MSTLINMQSCLKLAVQTLLGEDNRTIQMYGQHFFETMGQLKEMIILDSPKSDGFIKAYISELCYQFCDI